MKIVIIEDERLTAEALANMVTDLRPGLEVMARLSCVEEAVRWLQLHSEPDLIFCDIHLSDGNSFEIFKQVEVKCPVIFTTAYNQYAIEAFQVNSIDYLLKPMKKENVARALKKYEGLQQQQEGGQQLENLKKLLAGGPQSPGGKVYRRRFMVKKGQNLRTIPTSEIAYFYAEEGVVFVMSFKGERFLTDQTLQELEDQVDPTNFFRANRQMLVHIDAIKEVKPYFKGRVILNLKPAIGDDVVVSSNKTPEFKEWLGS